MSNDEIHRIFAESFAEGERHHSTRDELGAVELELGVAFPNSYLEFFCRYGVNRTPGLLNLVTGGEDGVSPEGAGFDISQFFSPADIVETTMLYRSGGMDQSLVAIAGDSMGNVFGFRCDANAPRPGDSPVYVFDHDFCEVRQEAGGFDPWLKSFIKMKA